jgi:hypothetical protein
MYKLPKMLATPHSLEAKARSPVSNFNFKETYR